MRLVECMLLSAKGERWLVSPVPVRFLSWGYLSRVPWQTENVGDSKAAVPFCSLSETKNRLHFTHRGVSFSLWKLVIYMPILKGFPTPEKSRCFSYKVAYW